MPYQKIDLRGDNIHPAYLLDRVLAAHIPFKPSWWTVALTSKMGLLHHFLKRVSPDFLNSQSWVRSHWGAPTASWNLELCAQVWVLFRTVSKSLLSPALATAFLCLVPSELHSHIYWKSEYPLKLIKAQKHKCRGMSMIFICKCICVMDAFSEIFQNKKDYH